MADARKLMPIILKWEGGFVNDPNDKGGATNKGVTISTFRAYYGADKSVSDLKNITDEQWLTIFRKGYWNPFKADDITSQSIANICVDWAWGSGTITAIKRVQTLLGVSVDGRVGAQTLAAINSADQKTLFERIKAARTDFVNAIVKRDATQGKFLKGWLNRINSFTFDK